MRILENIVLATPYLFLKKIPYAWIAAVALWAWPPVVSGLFLAIILLGLLVIKAQQYFWEVKVTREFQKNGRPYRDHPRLPPGVILRNLVLLLAGSALLGLLLGGRLELQGWQWFLLAAGLMFLYKDTLLLGASAVYLVTPRGIAVRYIPGHVDYRLFYKFDEIDRIVHVNPGDKLPENYWALTPTRPATSAAPIAQGEGLLLLPKRGVGFSRQLGPALLAPTDIPAFIERLPTNLVPRDVRQKT